MLESLLMAPEIAMTRPNSAAIIIHIIQLGDIWKVSYP